MMWYIMKRMMIFTRWIHTWFHAQLVQKILNGSREGRQPPAVSSKGLRGHPEAAEVHHHGGGAAAADGGDQPQLEAGDVFLHPWNAFLAHAHIVHTHHTVVCRCACWYVCMYVCTTSTVTHLKYYKHVAYALAHEMSFVRFSIFWPKKEV